jgi:hypothetical protein
VTAVLPETLLHATVVAQFVVDRNSAATLRATPPSFFRAEEGFDASVTDNFQVLDKAGRVAGAVARIQGLQMEAGEIVALEAELNFVLCQPGRA